MNITGQTSFTGGAKYKKSNNDPLFDQVTSIVKFQGFAGNTTVTDNISGAVYTAQDLAVISSGQSLFGSTSSLTTGTSGDRWTATNDGSFDLAGNDFCVELWFYPLATQPDNFSHLIGVWDSVTGLGWNVGYSGQGTDRLDFCWSVTGSFDAGRCFNSQSGTIVDDQWNHVAVVRSGALLQMYINGVLEATPGGNTNIGADVINYNALVPQHFAGQATNGQWFNGYIQESRITIGAPRYTANFTPPTESFPLAKYGQ